MREALMRRPVGNGIGAENASWSFAGIEETFTDHVRRSVPLYDEGHDLICRISDYFINNGSVAYDLGTSTGQLLAKLAARHQAKSGVTFIGIDHEESMIKHAHKAVSDRKNVNLEVADINLFEYRPCDLIAACYTIQFVPPRIRRDLINTIYRSLNWGGAFFAFRESPCSGRPISGYLHRHI